MISRILVALIVVVCLTVSGAFVPRTNHHHHHHAVNTRTSKVSSTTSILARKPLRKYDFIETRDMTPEEMQEYNQRSEDKMQQEFGAMTAISLVLSLPMLYLCWVAFFSE